MGKQKKTGPKRKKWRKWRRRKEESEEREIGKKIKIYERQVQSKEGFLASVLPPNGRNGDDRR